MSSPYGRTDLDEQPCTIEREATDQTHSYVREVKPDPYQPGKSRDRMICIHCEGVLYPWGRRFKTPGPAESAPAPTKG